MIDILHGFVMNEAMKPSLRVDAAKSLIAAEALNQKDEHKILSLMAPNGTTEQTGNRFLDKSQRLAIE